MPEGSLTAVPVRGQGTGTFSTFERDVARGKVYSSRLSSGTGPVYEPAARQFLPGTSASSPVQGQVVRFALGSQGFPPTVFTVPGGTAAGARGFAELAVTGPDQALLNVSVAGLGPLPPGTELTAWLVHDLVVPPTLDPADLAALPRFSPAANMPGQLFTVDGASPTVGRSDVPVWNTVAVPVRAGVLSVGPDGTAALSTRFADSNSLALDPRSLLGPGSGWQTGGVLPSGLVAAILTDTFMRPATVFPYLPPAWLPQRLAAITQAAVARFDQDGDGALSTDEAQAVPGGFLRAQDFSRVAITVEPVSRLTPQHLPTEQAVALVGLHRTQRGAS